MVSIEVQKYRRKPANASTFYALSKQRIKKKPVARVKNGKTGMRVFIIKNAIKLR